MRRVLALVRGLPPDGAVARQIADDPLEVEWSIEVQLLAAIAELLDEANMLFFTAHAKEGTPFREPIRIRRPGAEQLETTTRRPATSDELRRFFKGAVRYTGPAPSSSDDEGSPPAIRDHLA